MITTYPPPPGPRVELLRVRRIHSNTDGNHDAADQSPLPEQEKPPLVPALEDIRQLSDEALRLLVRDLQKKPQGDQS